MKIALSISGGGYRATSYSLGALSYLNHVKLPNKETTLLSQVSAISSVSGGSITSLSYANSLKKGDDFKTFFKDLHDFMLHKNVLDKGIENFVNDSETNSLIKGMAKAYDELLFDSNNDNNKTLQDLIPEKNNANHLEFLCINATDFNTGNDFKFIVKDEKIKLRSGNNFYVFNEGYEAKINLGLPLAASSCFPGGFEPIDLDATELFKQKVEFLKVKYADVILKKNTTLNSPLLTNQVEKSTGIFKIDPSVGVINISSVKTDVEDSDIENDYNEDDVEVIEMNQSVYNKLSLMDGGIVDNQGIDAIIQYDQSITNNNKFHKNNKDKVDPIDLVMAIDVASPSITPYATSNKKNIPVLGDMKLINLYYFIIFVNTLILISNIYAVYLKHTPLTIIFTVLNTVLLMTTFMMYKTKCIIRDAAEKSHVGIGKVKRMNDLTPNSVLQLLTNRYNSLSLLVTTVFMKYLRKKNLEELNQHLILKDKHIVNSIFHLKHETKADQHVKMKIFHLEQLYKDSNDIDKINRIKDICYVASTMGTSLWIPETDKGICEFQSTIVAGQITTCINFINYYDYLKNLDERLANVLDSKKSNNELSARHKIIEKQIKIMEPINEIAKKDMEAFLEDPYFLLKSLGIDANDIKPIKSDEIAKDIADINTTISKALVN